MSYIEVLKSIIIEGQQLLEQITAVPRDFVFERNARYVFVGVRQSGKSYMLYLRAGQLIREGHSLKEMLFVNFDDERLIGFTAADFDSILKGYGELFGGRPVLFLDEIQNVEGWEHFARRLANEKYMAYVTGSNAKMLSRDIATVLGGRYMEKYVFPYSFQEYLLAKGLSLGPNWQYGSARGEAQRYLGEYLNWGGFPEVNLYTNKRGWLNELYEKIILGDIIQRNGIKNETALRLVVKRLADCVKTPVSYNRIAGMLKGAGTSISVSSVSDYVRYCTEACMIFSMENFASKFSERNAVRKHYFIDTGLLHIFLTDSETALMENLCAITLRRKYMADREFEFYYYKKEVEIDFYIPSGKRGIQCSFSISDSVTFEREVRALEQFHKQYGLDEAEIVTYSEEMDLSRGDLRIRVVPLVKWLVENEGRMRGDGY
ncbi:MAG: ATP-binding protein [Muribaculaceae bacterium]|nr:ATP-binding protein [Muribaculaceae bacterium]